MTNTMELCGDVLEPPTLSHETHGISVFTCTLRVERLSGTADFPRVLLPAFYVPLARPGERLRVTGQLRSHNITDETGNHLLLHAWAYECERWEGTYVNHIALTGQLCRAPIYRRTPYGREIADLMLRVPRHPESSSSCVEASLSRPRCDYLPCICWGSVARRVAALSSHAPLTVEGRFQSRVYHKVVGDTVEERTAYEVSVATAVEGEELGEMI